MANSTTSIVRAEEDESAQVRELIERAKGETAEGIVEALHLLQDLEERGVIPLLRALVEQGDDVLRVLLGLFKRDQTIGGVKNVMALLQVFSAIPKDSMNTVLAGVAGGLEEASAAQANEKFGVYGLLKTLQDPDVSRAISFLTSFLKGMGRALGEERTGGATE
ncbi:DUF1641 domain-containing protein [Alicyclobacillus fastidiosus]|uniref:DUF1641 domain-containing protein n=1 Tax=Alicyclobacillus fastidiosus TaxID=392011 RepID=A0ABV5AHM8_9BACL|nr:DUF1641 domain-containing protein [Alicyclobacillus fastidiosus]WEH11532.1 DUF1641 domain-containing protein [Alicyclobacillus fastidiosus]